MTQWDELKRAERDAEAESTLAGVPAALPALSLSQTLLRRAASAGFAWPDRRDVLDKLNEELDELAAATSKDQQREEFGDLLLNLANYASYLEIDAEDALRTASRKFRARFEAVENATKGSARSMKEMSREELLTLWEAAKRKP